MAPEVRRRTTYPDTQEAHGMSSSTSEKENSTSAHGMSSSTFEKEDSVSSTSRKLVFKEKCFQERASLLTVLLETTEMAVVYNIWAAVFILMLMHQLLRDIFVERTPLYHTWLIWWNFNHFPAVMFVWATMFASTFLPYTVFKLWAHVPCKAVTFQNQIHLVAGFVLYMVGFFYFPLKFLFSWELNCASSFIITCETTRIMMKTYAFVRSNVERAVRKKEGLAVGAKDSSEPAWPTVEQFVYYQFCPSLIYRDSYPRSNTRDWKLVAAYFGHCLGIICFVNLTFVTFIQPYLYEIDYRSQSVVTSLLALFGCIFAGIACLLSLFVGLLHCWLNMWSEALQFADRQFYANWWSSKNMADYYRKWNLVVHEWLYAYVYRDVATLIGGRRGLKVAQTLVFFLSAAFHEYWFGVAFRLCYPVMFLLYFVFGGIFYSVSRAIKQDWVWNIALWFNLLIGTGMFVAFYGQEWYARERCAPNPNRLLDVVLPRHLSCH